MPIYELEVHRIELEMQNEELRRAQFEIEKSREEDIEFYDFAPVRYLNWRKSMIFSISLAMVSCSLSRM
jgi:hypothetical protein